MPVNRRDGEGMSLGVILGFPPGIAEELQRWRASFGDPMATVIPAHITLVTTTPTDDWEAARDHVREVARTQAPFMVTIAGTGSFRPVSPVVFINVAEGFEECVELHEKLQTGPLARDLAFPYHPHVTIAQDVPAEALDAAFDDLAGFSAKFGVPAFTLFSHGGEGPWRRRRDYPLGRT